MLSSKEALDSRKKCVIFTVFYFFVKRLTFSSFSNEKRKNDSSQNITFFFLLKNIPISLCSFFSLEKYFCFLRNITPAKKSPRPFEKYGFILEKIWFYSYMMTKMLILLVREKSFFLHQNNNLFENHKNPPQKNLTAVLFSISCQ